MEMRVKDDPITALNPTLEGELGKPPPKELEAAGFPDHIRMTEELFKEETAKFGPMEHFTLWIRGQLVYVVDRKVFDAAVRGRKVIAVRGETKDG